MTGIHYTYSYKELYHTTYMFTRCKHLIGKVQSCSKLISEERVKLCLNRHCVNMMKIGRHIRKL